MRRQDDLIIIGGGASGFLAALGARLSGFQGRAVIIEKEEQALRKVLASGNGRCNLVNINPAEGRFHGEDPSFALSVLNQHPASRVLDIFKEIGLLTVEDREGRIYPRSFQSRSVTTVLVKALESQGVELLFPHTVTHLDRIGDRYRVTLEGGGEVEGRAVIIATGSPAAPELGGTSLGYDLLRPFGHRVREPVPALVPLTVQPHPLTRLAEGVRFRGAASFTGQAGERAASSGEYLITAYGLSGIAGMDLGRAAGRAAAQAGGSRPTVGRLSLDFLPEWGREDIFDLLKKSGADDWRSALAGLVPEKVGQAVLAVSGLSDAIASRDAEAGILAGLVKGLDLLVTGTRGFTFAHVAAGGVLTEGFDRETLMSSGQPGLFACGELLDVDGDTGGFNLLWAFSSGFLAGGSAARFLEADGV